MNSLLGRAGDVTNSNPTSNRSNSTNSDTHTPSEQARIQAETALKGVEENNHRQREERNAKAQADSRARAQAEAQRKEAEDLNRHNLDNDLIHPGDDYYQLSSSIPHFSYAQSPSFGAHAQSVTLHMDDLTNSPHLLVDATAVFDTVTDSDSLASSLNTDINSLDYFLARSARRAHTGGKQTRPGELAWVKSPANLNGYHLYPDIDHNTNYGRLTMEMCAVAQVDYHGSYRTETILFSNQIAQTGLIPNPSDDSEYVPTRHIFAQWIDDILAKFETRYPHVLTCILYPDPFHDPRVRSFYINTMQTRNNRRPNGPTDREIQQARALLATRICDYNQANLFLASVIRKTVSKEQALFPLLHQYITNNTHQIANDAHTLLYAVKREMSHTQKTLSSKVNNEMQQLQISVDGTLPLIRPYISKLHALSILHRRLGGNITSAQLLTLFQEKLRALIHANPIHQNNTSLCDMLNGTQFNTWEKHLNFHATLSQDNAVQSSAQMYDAFLKTLGTSSSTTLVVANAASLTNDISAINETSIAGHKP